MRALITVRISNRSPESTSIPKQDGICTGFAEVNSHEIIGRAVDDGVSGTVNPFERPGLGPWLTPERADEYDAIIVWKIDRLSRRLLHFAAFLKWAEENKKVIIAVNDPIDTSTPVGKMIAHMIALVAEWEVETMRDRQRGSKAKLRTTIRFAGGKIPYGYWTRDSPQDGGKVLVIDESSARVLREIVEDVLSGMRPSAVRDKLNARAELSPTDYARQKKGLDPLGRKWSTQCITDMIRSRTIIGQMEHAPKEAYTQSGRRRKRTVVRGYDGMPMQRAEPIISQATYLRVIARLDELARPHLARHPKGMAAGLVKCCGCGRFVSKQTQSAKHSYYRCLTASGGRKCSNPAGVRQSDLEEALSRNVLESIGDVERTERVWIPAEDYSDELEAVKKSVEELREEWDLGFYSGDRPEYLARMRRLIERRDKLAALPPTVGHYDYIRVGETFGEAWSRMDDDAKRQLLAHAGIEATLIREAVANRGAARWHGTAHTLEIRIPLEVIRRARAMDNTGPSDFVRVIRVPL